MYFLFILCFCAAFLLGYDNKAKIDWVVVVGFAIMLSSTVFNIIDLDRPRSGLIDLDENNKKMVELREMFTGEYLNRNYPLTTLEGLQRPVCL